MSQEHVDAVRSIYAAWERGDFGSAEWADPEIEFVIIGGPDPGSWKGVGGMAEGWHRFLEAWDDFRVEPEEYVKLDSTRVLVLIRRTGRGKSSQMEVSQMQPEAADLFHFRDGKVVKLFHYWERRAAFAYLGAS
jgi:ketosteroid isomerase-like protein